MNIKPSLESIIYNYYLIDEKELNIILPVRYPNIKQVIKMNKNSKSYIENNNSTTVEITIFIQLKENIPKLNLICENKNSKILYNNSINNFIKNTTNIFKFITNDGGNTWLAILNSYSDVEIPSPENAIVSINEKTGPVVILTGSDISLSNKNNITIENKIISIENEIEDLSTTITNEITGEIVKILPDMIKTQIQNTEIIAEKI